MIYNNNFFEKNKFYKFVWKNENRDVIWFFKFESIKGYGITTSGYYYVLNTHSFIPRNTINFSKRDFFEEVNISVLIDYLPDDHIDKKIYIRKQKITNLLK